MGILLASASDSDIKSNELKMSNKTFIDLLLPILDMFTTKKTSCDTDNLD